MSNYKSRITGYQDLKTRNSSHWAGLHMKPQAESPNDTSEANMAESPADHMSESPSFFGGRPTCLDKVDYGGD
ncbi:hypothetical protein CTA1_12381 [Colletotrichum tanaceti]|uniref:Uncharacterized protein n=1 Tax=Colletotrichum tanaceti TaxID=1306861 RepID=A0A4U6XM39_9PEZI|nr:hypothetical protein CTA1_12381 [Colletotrichum tanaceti]